MLLDPYYFTADFMFFKCLEISFPNLNLFFAKLSSVNEG